MRTQNVVAAVIGERSRPEQLVLGLYDEAGGLRFAGRTAPLTAVQAARAAPFLREPAGEHPWPEEVPATAPVAAEVSADAARTGIAFRHSTRLQRFRPDRDPRSIRA